MKVPHRMLNRSNARISGEINGVEVEIQVKMTNLDNLLSMHCGPKYTRKFTQMLIILVFSTGR